MKVFWGIYFFYYRHMVSEQRRTLVQAITPRGMRHEYAGLMEYSDKQFNNVKKYIRKKMIAYGEQYLLSEAGKLWKEAQAAAEEQRVATNNQFVGASAAEIEMPTTVQDLFNWQGQIGIQFTKYHLIDFFLVPLLVCEREGDHKDPMIIEWMHSDENDFWLTNCMQLALTLILYYVQFEGKFEDGVREQAITKALDNTYFDTSTAECPNWDPLIKPDQLFSDNTQLSKYLPSGYNNIATDQHHYTPEALSRQPTHDPEPKAELNAGGKNAEMMDVAVDADGQHQHSKVSTENKEGPHESAIAFSTVERRAAEKVDVSMTESADTRVDTEADGAVNAAAEDITFVASRAVIPDSDSLSSDYGEFEMLAPTQAPRKLPWEVEATPRARKSPTPRPSVSPARRITSSPPHSYHEPPSAQQHMMSGALVNTTENFEPAANSMATAFLYKNTPTPELPFRPIYINRKRAISLSPPVSEFDLCDFGDGTPERPFTRVTPAPEFVEKPTPTQVFHGDYRGRSFPPVKDRGFVGDQIYSVKYDAELHQADRQHAVTVATNVRQRLLDNGFEPARAKYISIPPITAPVYTSDDTRNMSRLYGMLNPYGRLILAKQHAHEYSTWINSLIVGLKDEAEDVDRQIADLEVEKKVMELALQMTAEHDANYKKLQHKADQFRQEIGGMQSQMDVFKQSSTIGPGVADKLIEKAKGSIMARLRASRGQIGRGATQE